MAIIALILFLIFRKFIMAIIQTIIAMIIATIQTIFGSRG